MNSAHGPCACAARSRSNATSCSAWWHSRSIKYSASRSSGPRRPERRPLRPREHRENSPRSMNFARGSRAKGLVLVGTPPVGPDTFSKGFRASPHFKLAAEAKWSDADVERFGHAVFDEAFSPDLKTALVRADGIARSSLFEARRAGVGADQRKLVESLTMPIAVLNGAEDPFINLDYLLDSISFKNLWRGQCQRIVGAGHAPFLQKPTVFNEISNEYLAELANHR